MPIESLAEDIALSTSLEVLISAYQKVSVSRMQKIRGQVLAARTFTEELAQVYYQVRRGQRRSPDRPKTKPLALLLAANQRLDGGISQAIFRPFAEYIRQHECDVVIGGEVGRILFRNTFPHYSFEYIPLPAAPIKSADLQPFVHATANHTDVRIFYGKFVNFIYQQPAIAKLSDEEPVQAAGAAQGGGPRYWQAARYGGEDFIFEPSLKKVIAYFDTQILTALISRTSQETSLAEHGSRVTAMEEARQRINNQLKDLAQQVIRIQRAAQNKKQREQLASIQLWNA